MNLKAIGVIYWSWTISITSLKSLGRCVLELLSRKRLVTVSIFNTCKLVIHGHNDLHLVTQKSIWVIYLSWTIYTSNLKIIRPCVLKLLIGEWFDDWTTYKPIGMCKAIHSLFFKQRHNWNKGPQSQWQTNERPMTFQFFIQLSSFLFKALASI